MAKSADVTFPSAKYRGAAIVVAITLTLGATGRDGARMAAPPEISSTSAVDTLSIEGGVWHHDRDEAAHELGPGEASYYGQELGGLPTASGEPFDPESLTAAHRTLPIGSIVRVTNPGNGKSVVVRINDRGPSLLHRIIDLSEEAAKHIGMLGAGTAVVNLELLR